MLKTIDEPMYMATRFYLWCGEVGADPMAYDVRRWIG